MKSYKYKKPLTARQQAAILRLYVQQRLSTLKTAERLQLSVDHVVQFLRERGVMRCQGPAIGRKISLSARQNLEGELATTRDAVLARKYGVSGERIRQIRQQLGYPSSQILRHAWGVRALAKRRKQKKLARELRQQQRRAKRMLAVNRLSERWKSGVLVAELAQEFGATRDSLYTQIVRLRKQFPEKFPFRYGLRSPRHLKEVR
jgi:predicted DNA-binding protein YlxM (UPF0122 family)